MRRVEPGILDGSLRAETLGLSFRSPFRHLSVAWYIEAEGAGGGTGAATFPDAVRASASSPATTRSPGS
jgi:hypothetical protein